jgi:molecular chaperone DnaK (HSP70)
LSLIVSGGGGTPKIQVEFKGETKIFLPEKISSMVMVRMKEITEAYLGYKVTDAVITGQLISTIHNVKPLLSCMFQI